MNALRALALVTLLSSGAQARTVCTDLRGRVETLGVSPTEQQGLVTVRGRKLDGYRVASLRGVIVGAGSGGFLLDHSLVFTHPKRPAARLVTAGDVAVLTPTADPCVMQVVETVHLARGEGAFADVDPAATTGEARGTINTCTGQNRFDLTVRLCRSVED